MPLSVRAFAGWSVFLILVHALAPVSALAADAAEYRDLKNRIKAAQAEQKEIKRDLDAAKKEKRKLESQRQPDADQSTCESCGVQATKCKSNIAEESNPCKDGACAISAEPSNTLCYRIFKGSCYNHALTAGDRSHVDSCWMVARDHKLVEVNAQIKGLEDQLKDDDKEIADLGDEVDQLLEDCPTCGQDKIKNLLGGLGNNIGTNANGITIQQREPSTFEKIMMGIGVGGSLALGGVNAYLGYKANSNFYDSYNNYMNNSVKMGMPFYPPTQYGGAFGASMGTMGASPMMYGMYGGSPYGSSPFGGSLYGSSYGSPFGGGIGIGMGMGMGSPYGGMGYPGMTTGYPGIGGGFPGMGMGIGMGGMPGMGMGGFPGMAGYGTSPFNPYGGMGMGQPMGMGITGGIGVGMPNLFPGGGIFPNGNGGIAIGPWTGYSYMNPSMGASSIFPGGMGAFWGSPMAGAPMGGYAPGMGAFPGMGGMPMGMGGMPMGMGGMPMGMGGMPMGMGGYPGMGMPSGMGGMPMGIGGYPSMGMPMGMGGFPGMGSYAGMGMPMGMGSYPSMGGMPMGMGSPFGGASPYGGSPFPSTYGSPFASTSGSPFGGSPFGASPFGASPYGGSPFGGSPGLMPGFPGMPGGPMYGGYPGALAPGFPGGPSTFGYPGSSGGLYSPTMNSSWPQTANYGYQQQMSTYQNYQQQAAVLMSQMSSVQSRYQQMYQQMMSGGTGTGIGGIGTGSTSF